MIEAVLSAGSVLAAEAVVRTQINRAPDGTYPHMLSRRIQIRRAHNSGLAGSRLDDRPALATAIQTVSMACTVGVAALACSPGMQVPIWGRVGAGLLVGGALSNTGERWFKQHVTDYVCLRDSRLPLLRRRIWNLADAAIFNGAILTAAGLVLGGNL